MQSYLNRDSSVLQQKGRHAILSYFQTVYHILLFDTSWGGGHSNVKGGIRLVQKFT